MTKSGLKEGENLNPHVISFQLGEVLELMFARHVPGMKTGDSRVQRALGLGMINALYTAHTGTHALDSSGKDFSPEVAASKNFLRECLSDLGRLRKMAKNGGLIQILATGITKI